MGWQRGGGRERVHFSFFTQRSQRTQRVCGWVSQKTLNPTLLFSSRQALLPGSLKISTLRARCHCARMTQSVEQLVILPSASYTYIHREIKRYFTKKPFSGNYYFTKRGSFWKVGITPLVYKTIYFFYNVNQKGGCYDWRAYKAGT